MVKTKIKRAVSFVMATVLSLSAFMSIGTSTAFAASGEKTKVYMVDFPRDGDANYDGVWGHSNLTLKNGWHTGSSTHTNLKASVVTLTRLPEDEEPYLQRVHLSQTVWWNSIRYSDICSTTRL